MKEARKAAPDFVLARIGLAGRPVANSPTNIGVAMVGRIIETLRSARQRTPMYLSTVDVASAENFLNGFQVACLACGLEVPIEIQERVTIARGWKWSTTRLIEEMRERGLNESEIVDELFAIEIAAWELANA